MIEAQWLKNSTPDSHLVHKSLVWTYLSDSGDKPLTAEHSSLQNKKILPGKGYISIDLLIQLCSIFQEHSFLNDLHCIINMTTNDGISSELLQACLTSLLPQKRDKKILNISYAEYVLKHLTVQGDKEFQL